MARVRHARRLYVNGFRQIQGEEKDWYLTTGGKIISNQTGIDINDAFLMEYADGTEEELKPEDIYKTCHMCYKAIVSLAELICKECKINAVKMSIETTENKINELLEEKLDLQKELAELEKNDEP